MDNISRNVVTRLISAAFVVWAVGLVYRSSCIAVDGHRYFGLIDDAMISMRYAWNLSHGLGLVWNPGENVEGYTNLLMVLLMAVVTFFLDKSASVLVVQLSGIPLMLGTAWLVMKIAAISHPEATAHRSAFVETAAFTAALCYYPLGFWSLMGMETGLLAVFINLAILSSLIYRQRQQPKYLWLTGLALGLGYLTRNDSLIFALIVFVFLMGGIGKPSWSRAKQLLPAAALYAGFIAAQTVFRVAYYGSLLPNTYVLKLVGMPVLVRLRNGVGFIEPFLAESALLVLIAVGGIVWRFTPQKAYLAAFVFAAVAYEIYAGGDYSSYWRIMAPVVPVLFVVFIETVVEFVELHKPSWSSQRQSGMSRAAERFGTAAVSAALMLVVGVSINFRFVNEILFINSFGDDNLDYVNRAVAINAVTAPDASVGVFRAGVIPYYTGRPAVDFLGKSDPYIANLPPDISGRISGNGTNSLPGHNKYDLNYSIKLRRPTYVEGFAWGSQDLREWAKDTYVAVKYGDVELNLLKDSSLVYWNQLTPVK